MATICALLVVTFSAVFPTANAAVGDTDQYMILNGSTQYGGNTTAATLDSFNAISIELWINPSGSVCSGNLVARRNAFAIYCTSTGYLNYALQGAVGWSGVDTGFLVPTNEWHHIALTRAANTNSVNMYYDGQLFYTGTADGAQTSSISSASSTPLNIGARNNSTTFFNGAIDEVRISNVVRPVDDIRTDMTTWGIGNENGVVAYYDFNDVSGTSVLNKIPNAPSDSNLTLTGTPTFTNIESTSLINGKVITTFKRSYLSANGGWKVPTDAGTVDLLVIAGGGGGGSRAGGGGGAGGYVLASNLSLTPGANETITVGIGGLSYVGGRSSNGGNSVFGSRRSALGGGSGGGASGLNNINRVGSNGGSGGGASGDYNTANSSAAYGYGNQNSTIGYGSGNNGGSGLNNATGWAGGGGGGAGGGGTNGVTATGGAGGSGVIDPIGGTTTCFASGGGGGVNSGFTGGSAGTCAGGITTAGVGTSGNISTGTNAKANSGSGGGGSGYSGGTDAWGGAGGSGIVIVRYVYINTVTQPTIGTDVAIYRNSTALTVTSAVAARATFYFQGKIISGCRNIATTTTGSNFTATCSWKPSLHGLLAIRVVVVPTDTYIASATRTTNISVVKRTNNR
jgi:hypothetical protein